LQLVEITHIDTQTELGSNFGIAGEELLLVVITADFSCKGIFTVDAVTLE